MITPRPESCFTILRQSQCSPTFSLRTVWFPTTSLNRGEHTIGPSAYIHFIFDEMIFDVQEPLRGLHFFRFNERKSSCFLEAAVVQHGGIYSQLLGQCRHILTASHSLQGHLPERFRILSDSLFCHSQILSLRSVTKKGDSDWGYSTRRRVH